MNPRAAPPPPEPHRPFELRTLVLLAVAAGAAVLAYHHPSAAVPVTLGLTVLLTLNTLLKP